jgi:hypothetical protein
MNVENHDRNQKMSDEEMNRKVDEKVEKKVVEV